MIISITQTFYLQVLHSGDITYSAMLYNHMHESKETSFILCIDLDNSP